MKTLLLFLLFPLISFSNDYDSLKRQLDILAEEIESLKIGKKVPASSFFGLGQSASKVYNSDGGLSIGGYGELFLNIPFSEDENGNEVSNSSKAEALRNVIYLGYKFNSNWILNTEIEIEHVDEIFLEFAYVDYLHSDQFNFRSGLILVPLGLVNELHEPIYFNSVNRPELEKYIIPSTWRELGLGAFGVLGKKLTYKAYLLNGMNAVDEKSKSFLNSGGLRNGRKKGGVNSNASTLSFVGRVDYELNSKFNIGLGVYSGSASSQNDSVGPVGVNLYQLHSIFNYNNFYIKGIYVQADLSDTTEFNTVLGQKLASRMNGYYLDLGYSFYFGEKILTPFIRYEEVDTQNKLENNLAKDLDKIRTNITIGASFRPIDRIIFKADYISRKNDGGSGVDEYNLSVGYLF